MKKKNNIFADLELEEADELALCSDLMSEVVSIIRISKKTQKEIASILGVNESKVSALVNGKINDFSNGTLIHYLTLLGCDIEIRIMSPHHISKSIKKGSVKVNNSYVKKRNIKVKA